MAHIRYTVDDAAENRATGKLLYVTFSVYGSDWKSYPHSHYYTELFLVTGGKGFFHVEDQRVPVSRGSLVLINPHVKHAETSSKTSPLEYAVLAVENLCFIFSDGKSDCRLFFDEGDAILTLFRSIEHEMRLKDRHFEAASQCLLEMLIILLLRRLGQDAALSPPKNLSSECSMVKRYIDEHFQENITLDTLAELSHLNKFYLAHKFAGEYGVSPIQYLIARRIRCGKEQMEGTDLSISAIAQVSGFSSQSYFCQVFRKNTGMSPSEYRRQLGAGR